MRGGRDEEDGIIDEGGARVQSRNQTGLSSRGTGDFRKEGRKDGRKDTKDRSNARVTYDG